MPCYEVSHSTAYRFDHPIDKLVVTCCLTPQVFASQEIRFQQIVTTPLCRKRNSYTDRFGNVMDVMAFERPLQTIEITSVLKLDVLSLREPRSVPAVNTNWHELFEPQELETILSAALKFAPELFSAHTELLPLLTNLMDKLYREFVYDTSATTIDTSVVELFQLRCGVCQDFARVLIAVLHANEIEARYVSGYLFDRRSGQSTVVQAASHAWVSVYLPDLGWVDLDPVNNQWVDENYIMVAWGRDYVDVIPVDGMLDEDRCQSVTVSVTIENQQD